jgi:hypothetical protein
MFGSNYAQNFGLPGFPWTGMDPQGGMFQPAFTGMENGQPVPGTPGGTNAFAPGGGAGSPAAAAGPPGGPSMATSQPDAGLGPSANPSVDALRTGNPLAVGAGGLAAGAGGAAPPSGAGAPALPWGAGRRQGW